MQKIISLLFILSLGLFLSGCELLDNLKLAASKTEVTSEATKSSSEEGYEDRRGDDDDDDYYERRRGDDDDDDDYYYERRRGNDKDRRGSGYR